MSVLTQEPTAMGASWGVAPTVELPAATQSHLDLLEAEAVYIPRETAELSRPVRSRQASSRPTKAS